MRLQLKASRRSARLLVVATLLLPARGAGADEASGTWSGKVEGVGNYYWERSTRVIVPTFGAELVAPNGVRVDVRYLVDVISSASIAQTGRDEDAVFTERRHGIHAGIGKEFDTGATPLDLRVHGIYSIEDDYTSTSVGLGAALSFDERASVLRLSVAGLHDDIQSNADPARDENLDGIAASTSWEHVLSPQAALTLGYQLGYLNGFTANIYRRALIGPLPFPEDHPRERWRHTTHVRLQVFVPETATAFHFMPRGYADSWEIRALDPELRVYQELGSPALLVRLRYRFYAQTAAEFFRATYAAGYEGHVTNDPKMTAFRTHTAGLKLDVGLGGLERTFLEFARRGTLYFNFDRIWNSNIYGNGIVLQAGGILPF